MTLALSSHPSSQAFELINTALTSDPAERKDAIKKGGAVFSFVIKNAEGAEEKWYIDLKEKGEVGRGAHPEGGKADGVSPAVPYRRDEC
jgi:SCP-2 sterol transfer family